MHAVVVPGNPGWTAWLEERRRRGQDRFDEVWDGVLHVVPFPNEQHQRFEGALEAVLRPLVLRAGLEIFHNFGVYEPGREGDDNYRGPDISIAAPPYISHRGIEGRAELVVEILSPNDESRAKAGFYATCGIPEFWIVHPGTREIEIYVLRGGAYELQPTRDDGTIEAPRLGLTVRVIEGPKLRIDWAGGSADI
jgi:Uma2 family endonuclease